VTGHGIVSDTADNNSRGAKYFLRHPNKIPVMRLDLAYVTGPNCG